MSDNVTANAGSGSDPIAAVDILRTAEMLIEETTEVSTV